MSDEIVPGKTDRAAAQIAIHGVEVDYHSIPCLCPAVAKVIAKARREAKQRGARRERMRVRRLLGPLISKMHKLILDGCDYQELDTLKHEIYLVAWPPRKRKETGK